MNIVDINYGIRKFSNKLVIRHTTHVTHMASILTFDGKYINKNTSHVVKKYNKLLDIKKLSIITKCITNNIRVRIMFYKMNINDIDLIVTTSLDCGNKHYLKIINNNINIIKKTPNEYMQEYIHKLLYKNNINAIMFFVKILQFNDIDDNNDKLLISHLCENGYLNVIKYLHKYNVLSIHYFQFQIITACKNGHINIVKYLHTKVGLTTQDFRSCDNIACCLAVSNGNLKTVKYLHTKIGLTKDDFKSRGIMPCIFACCNSRLDIVKYFFQEIVSIYEIKIMAMIFIVILTIIQVPYRTGVLFGKFITRGILKLKSHIA